MAFSEVLFRRPFFLSNGVARNQRGASKPSSAFLRCAFSEIVKQRARPRFRRFGKPYAPRALPGTRKGSASAAAVRGDPRGSHAAASVKSRCVERRSPSQTCPLFFSFLSHFSSQAPPFSPRYRQIVLMSSETKCFTRKLFCRKSLWLGPFKWTVGREQGP